MKIIDLPFHIGATEKPNNPALIPNTFPFELGYEGNLSLLEQGSSKRLEEILQTSYQLGQLIGTPLADNTHSKPYADDFLNFISAQALPSGNALEIGAGTGYLSRRLKDEGWETTALEPGKEYEPYWQKYKINVVRDFFPSARICTQFDLIYGYAVFEHISNKHEFLENILGSLKPEGAFILSVPDCTEEILAGDPAMLLHEHFTYFDAGSLERVLWDVGFVSEVQKSRFGRCLYVVAWKNRSGKKSDLALDIPSLESYPTRCENFILNFKSKLFEKSERGSLGFFCPGRGLALFDPNLPMRFFDDSPDIQGRYIPPFRSIVESSDDLLANPVDALVILSRTFCEEIKERLLAKGYQSRILTINDMENEIPS